MFFKKIASKLPALLQNDLKRFYYRRQISKGAFVTNEPEYAVLHQFIKPGDWVIDVGANIGHYTKRLSDLVGKEGRVIAFEPVPATFSLLASNVQLFEFQNTTLINVALSNKLSLVGMAIPKLDSGLANYYQAQISAAPECDTTVLSLSLDSFDFDRRIVLIKIDAEGHEMPILNGMKALLTKWHPVLIIETNADAVIAMLAEFGYQRHKYPDSPNILFKADIPS